MADYFTPGEVQNLQDAISECTDAIKYLYNVSNENPDHKFRTPELEEAFFDLVNACKDLQGTFEYYAK